LYALGYIFLLLTSQILLVGLCGKLLINFTIWLAKCTELPNKAFCEPRFLARRQNNILQTTNWRDQWRKLRSPCLCRDFYLTWAESILADELPEGKFYKVLFNESLNYIFRVRSCFQKGERQMLYYDTLIIRRRVSYHAFLQELVQKLYICFYSQVL